MELKGFARKGGKDHGSKSNPERLQEDFRGAESFNKPANLPELAIVEVLFLH